jgi:hypothetical protein
VIIGIISFDVYTLLIRCLVWRRRYPTKLLWSLQKKLWSVPSTRKSVGRLPTRKTVQPTTYLWSVLSTTDDVKSRRAVKKGSCCLHKAWTQTRGAVKKDSCCLHKNCTVTGSSQIGSTCTGLHGEQINRQHRVAVYMGVVRHQQEAETDGSLHKIWPANFDKSQWAAEIYYSLRSLPSAGA